MRRLIGALVAVWLAVLAVPGTAWAEEKKEVPLATRLAAKSHPAVQLLATTYSATLSVPTAEPNNAEVQRLAQETARRVLNGEIPRDDQSLYKYILEQFAADVDRFLKPSEPVRTVEAKVTGTCTGWWVTPDGYMVTGAHCVKPDAEELGRTFAKQALDQINKQDVAALIQSIAQEGQASSANVEIATRIVVNFNAKHLRIGETQQSTAVLQSVQGGGVDKTAKELPVEVVSAGESYPGKDVALLKVNGQQNLPTLELGNDDDVQVGDTLYIDGFPGTVTNNGSLSIDSKLQPTFTQGPYNAQRSTQGGVPYFQTQAPAYGGNSGGPVFSDSGRVVGILIAGLNDTDGQSAQNQQLVLPVSVVKEHLNGKNVKPVASTTTVSYNKALDSYFKRHYKRALPKFREVQALNPGHPYVNKYISDSQAAINAGKDETPSPIIVWVLIGGAVLVVVIIVVVLVSTLRRRSRRRPGPGGPGGPGGGFPPVPGSSAGGPGNPYGAPQPGLPVGGPMSGQPTYPGGPPPGPVGPPPQPPGGPGYQAPWPGAQ
ncbi:S1 family peptidase [Thermomonospora umbrina]|uniref:Trypsin-like peptidase n=1 Tax=Thermomonospora umbrina TaxID=111806 RepID=A0A3D9SUI5_9ACTN|nr:serine protease [Thermomonospora umbrina]REE99267.1 trypsin-like peptidase [Thermomonospora umbrina]